MTKKTSNLLITALVVVVLGGFLRYLALPFLLLLTKGVLSLILVLAVPVLFLYGVYYLVRLVNK